MPGAELDLFGTPEPQRSEPKHDEPRVFSVTEITRAVRTVIEEGVGTVWVEGEVSNYRRQASGHQYFTLKDANSQLACGTGIHREGRHLRAPATRLDREHPRRIVPDVVLEQDLSSFE